MIKELFGKYEGQDVYRYTLDNGIIKMCILNWGCVIQKLIFDGVDVECGFDKMEEYAECRDYYGATVGRYANRIAEGKFSIDGVEYSVEKNEKGITCLHGGGELSTAVWKAIIVDDNSLEMLYTSPDGAMGFPGKVDFKVTFTLHEDDALKIDYEAVSDKKTVINMTNHAYFNLAGKGDVLGQELMINADAFTPMDANSIPTGEIRPVEGTPFDFRVSKPIGKDIAADDDQLVIGKGYDHNFCLNEGDGPAAVAYDPESGRMLEVFTDLCGVQLYTGNFLDGTKPGKKGEGIIKNAGFCLETQYYPNTPNMPEVPQCTIDAGEKFTSCTVFRFSVK